MRDEYLNGSPLYLTDEEAQELLKLAESDLAYWNKLPETRSIAKLRHFLGLDPDWQAGRIGT